MGRCSPAPCASELGAKAGHPWCLCAGSYVGDGSHRLRKKKPGSCRSRAHISPGDNDRRDGASCCSSTRACLCCKTRAHISPGDNDRRGGASCCSCQCACLCLLDTKRLRQSKARNPWRNERRCMPCDRDLTLLRGQSSCILSRRDCGLLLRARYYQRRCAGRLSNRIDYTMLAQTVGAN